MTYPPPQPPPGTPLEPGRQQPGTITVRRNLALVGVLGVAGVVGLFSCGVGAMVGAADPSVAAVPSPKVTVTKTVRVERTVTAQAPPSSAAPTKPADTRVKLPDVVGKNGAIAAEDLKKAGFTNVQYASGDPTASVVLLPANWRVTKQEPAAGKRANPGDLVVLTMRKAG